MAKNSSPSRAPKNLRSTPGQPGGERSNRLAAINTAMQLVGIMSRFPVRTVERSTNCSKKSCSDFQVRTAMELHGSGLRNGVHIHVENVEIRLKAEHLSLHIYGHVNNPRPPRELHLWNLDGNLLHNRNVHHSQDELNLGHEDSNL